MSKIAARSVRQYFALGVLVVLLLVVFAQQQAVADWFRLRGYAPAAEVAALARDTAMTERGRHLFYINRPTLDDKAAFRQSCPNEREESVVLGCYHPVQRGIAVLRVEDARLDGVEEVTAAHEMLHAAYDRLSNGERERIDGLIAGYSRTGLRDERIRTTLAAYSAEERPNEMHSIFGTEVAELPAELERYYNRYFGRREQVVAAAARYTAAFTSRKQEVAAYDAQLSRWQAEIRRLSADLEVQEAELTAARRQLETYEAAGQTDRYNQAVPAYNARVERYNATVARIRALIAQYNRTVEQRNAIALEEQDLQRQLDSSYQPVR